MTDKEAVVLAGQIIDLLISEGEKTYREIVESFVIGKDTKKDIMFVLECLEESKLLKRFCAWYAWRFKKVVPRVEYIHPFGEDDL